MRVFIAVEFKDEVKRYLKDVQDVVKLTTYNGNFTHYDNFHLTVKYIGEIYNGEYEDLCQCVDDICDRILPFSIKIGDIGFFNKKSTNIVWVGISRNKEKILKLHRYTDQITNDMGFAPELRKFRPHVTIGKKVIFSDFGFTSRLPFYDEKITVDRITIMESSRIDGILTYTPLYSKKLGEKSSKPFENYDKLDGCIFNFGQ